MGASAFSTIANALTEPTTPALQATAISAQQVNLSWTAVTGATSYVVKSSADGGTTWTTIATQSGTVFANTGLTADTAYQYTVKAVDATGSGVASSPVTATTWLAAPTGFAVTPVSATEIDLSWAVVADATTYTIRRSTDNAIWTTLSPNPAPDGTATSYNDTSVLPGTTYYYRISAVNALGSSVQAAVQHTQTVPATPMGLTATAVSATEVDLS